MAITVRVRHKQAGLETQDLQEFDGTWTYAPYVSSASPKTGSWCLRFNGPAAIFWTVTASEFQAGFYLLYPGMSLGSALVPIFWRDGGTEIGRVEVDTGGTGHLYIEGSEVDSSSTAMSLGTGVDYYHHLGLHVRMGSTGFATVWLNGTPWLHYEGSFTSGSATQVEFGYENIFHQPSETRMDDLWLDEVGSDGPTVPDALQFLPLFPVSDAITEFDTVVGASTHVEAVDDFISGSHDGATTYVESSVPGQRDFWTVEGVAASQLSASQELRAIITVLVAQKTTTGSSLIVPGIRSASTIAYSASENLGTAWGIVAGRFTINPATGTSWTREDTQDMEIGAKAEP